MPFLFTNGGLSRSEKSENLTAFHDLRLFFESLVIKLKKMKRLKYEYFLEIKLELSLEK